MKRDGHNKRSGIVYSTNPDFTYDTGCEEDSVETLPPARQRLRVRMERAGRNGKTVTVVTGFVGKPDDLKALGKWLKAQLGTGGSTKDGDILIQGDARERITALLKSAGYTDAR